MPFAAPVITAALPFRRPSPGTPSSTLIRVCSTLIQVQRETSHAGTAAAEAPSPGEVSLDLIPRPVKRPEAGTAPPSGPRQTASFSSFAGRNASSCSPRSGCSRRLPGCGLRAGRCLTSSTPRS